jgi:hypothetical protein
MRLGVGRLVFAIASVVARMNGDYMAADLLAFAFLAGATLNLYRTRVLLAVSHAVRS